VYYNEPFLADNRSAEWGFCWENAVFGGYINQVPENHNAFLTVSEWPSFRRRYPEAYPWRGPFPACTVEYLVPTYYMRNIQSQRTWKSVANLPPSTSTFRIRRAVRIRYDHEGDEIDQEWAPPADETHTSISNRVVRDIVAEDGNGVGERDARTASYRRYSYPSPRPG